MPALASRDFEAPKSNEATSPIPILRFIKANTFIATERPLAKQLNLVILHYATSGILVFLEDVDQLLKLASIEPGAAKFSMAEQLADPVVPDDDDSNQEADTEAEPEAIARVEREPFPKHEYGFHDVQFYVIPIFLQAPGESCGPRSARVVSRCRFAAAGRCAPF